MSVHLSRYRTSLKVLAAEYLMALLDEEALTAELERTAQTPRGPLLIVVETRA
jgi:hypothetical protein